MELLIAIAGGSCAAALVSGVVELIRYFLDRKERRSSGVDSQKKALRYLMLYIIQERAKQHIRDGTISLEERRSLHHWHTLYHEGLGGTGDADVLMRQVDGLPLNTMDGQEGKQWKS